MSQGFFTDGVNFTKVGILGPCQLPNFFSGLLKTFIVFLWGPGVQRFQNSVVLYILKQSKSKMYRRTHSFRAHSGIRSTDHHVRGHLLEFDAH